MTRVLLAEDDPAISEPLARALRREGYDVDVRADGRAALEGANESPDLVRPGPRAAAHRRARGLPADPRRGPRRCRSSSSPRAPTRSTRWSGSTRAPTTTSPSRSGWPSCSPGCGPCCGAAPTTRRRPATVVRIDPEARRAFFNDEELQLTAKEFDLLRVLVREQGKVVSREQLMREIWETAWFGSTKTLDMHISVLRRKLGDDAAQPRYIATVRGVGFRFERGDRS